MSESSDEEIAGEGEISGDSDAEVDCNGMFSVCLT